MEREGEAAGSRVVAAHLVCLCCGGGWRKPIGFWRIFLGRILGRNSLHTDDGHRTPDDSLIFSSIEVITLNLLFVLCILT